MMLDENYSLRPVPHYARKKSISLAFVLMGLTLFSASMVTGGEVFRGLENREFLYIVLAGNLVLGVYTSILGYIGCTTGLSTHLLTHFSFGSKGSWLPSLLLGGTQVGWFGVGVAMFAIPVNSTIGIDIEWVILVSGFLMVITAYFGISSLIFLSTIAVPAILLIGGYSVFVEAQSIRWDSIPVSNEATLDYSSALAMVIGTFISAGTLTADFTRFCRGKKRAILITMLAFFVGNSVMFIFGAIGVISVGYADVFDVLLAQGLMIPAIVLLGLNIWTTNDNALYVSGLAFANVTRRPSQYISMANGIVGTLFALWMYNHFIEWLSFLSLAIPPIGAVIIADYLQNRQRYYDYTELEFKSVNWAGIYAVVIGITAGLLLPGIVPINAVIGSIVAYLLLNRWLNPMTTHQ
ncbi:cytosine permease [Vibrio tapetis subsp. quintayensis]|uniref:cytosine permease n=1 Tax=Vibrio tapetis TaxID=52443 RepID=UPI0025B3EE3B|nr:cytosine permease [Vibrio tapetis]MDN3681917.1 cytosine permease [Vibrio tapetis subsp. quintayensis]